MGRIARQSNSELMNSLASSGLTEKARNIVGAILAHVLNEESRLAATTRRYAWRARGSAVQSLARLFVEQGRQIERWLGEVRAQARAAGVSLATSSADANSAGVPTAANEPPAPPAVVIGELLALHRSLADRLRRDVDALERREPTATVTTVLTRMLEFHETTVWMLRLVLETHETSGR